MSLPAIQLVPIPFRAGEILALQKPDGGVHVVIKRICETLGVDFSGQLQKLRSYHWATVEMISTVDPNSREREVCVLPLDQVPMWLVTIHPSKVAEEYRDDLKAYQLEARDVLARHFLKGQAVPAPLIKDPILATLEAIGDVRRRQLEQEERLSAVEARTVALEAQANGDTGFMALLGFCKLRGINLPRAELARIGAKLRKHCDATGIEFRSIRDEHYGKVNLWPVELLESWASQTVH